MLNIAVSNDARQEFTTRLNGQQVRLSIWYQDAGAGWYMSIESPFGTPITTGARLNASVPVLAGLLTSFVGDIIPISFTTPAIEPGRQAWGDTHRLVYVTPAELEGLNLEIIQT